MADSESREMYLKSIYELEEDDGLVAVSNLAKRMGVSTVSATEMVKRLEEQALVAHTPYKGVALTEEGRLRALVVIRRQRLWGRFMADHLNIRWAQIYDLSCRLEHATDATVTEALADFLGHPETCPHGNPIPKADGSIASDSAAPLVEFKIGQEVKVIRIDQPETTLCNYLEDRNILPGVSFELVDEAPYNGPITVRLAKGEEIALGREISARIFVESLGTAEKAK